MYLMLSASTNFYNPEKHIFLVVGLSVTRKLPVCGSLYILQCHGVYTHYTNTYFGEGELHHSVVQCTERENITTLTMAHLCSEIRIRVYKSCCLRI